MSNEDLFGYAGEPTINFLPYDGEAYYYGVVFGGAESEALFMRLFSSISWQHDQIKIYGKTITTKRKVAWYGDKPFSYTYSNATKYALPWNPTLKSIKSVIEKETQATFNSCLLNLYHTGEEGMAWHSDAEKDLKKEGVIASVSLGAQRKFCFKHKLDSTVKTVFLESGSLMVMKGKTQNNWLHRLPPTKKVLQPRINLTFRTIVTAQ